MTVCNNNQYESAAPTATSDRICSPITTCGPNQYETQAPTGYTDRVCSPLTVCNSNQYERTAPTATSDRVCSNKKDEGQTCNNDSECIDNDCDWVNWGSCDNDCCQPGHHGDGPAYNGDCWVWDCCGPSKQCY